MMSFLAPPVMVSIPVPPSTEIFFVAEVRFRVSFPAPPTTVAATVRAALVNVTAPWVTPAAEKLLSKVSG